MSEPEYTEVHDERDETWWQGYHQGQAALRAEVERLREALERTRDVLALLDRHGDLCDDERPALVAARAALNSEEPKP